MQMTIDTEMPHPVASRFVAHPLPFAQRSRDNCGRCSLMVSSSPRRAYGPARWSLCAKKRWHLEDYRNLNLVKKPDVFLATSDGRPVGPVGTVEVLHYTRPCFRVKVHPHSREKTVFITPHGLYEFRVMPFGLRPSFKELCSVCWRDSTPQRV